MLLKWQICCELFSSVWQITMEGYSIEQHMQIIKFILLSKSVLRSRNVPRITWFLSSSQPSYRVDYSMFGGQIRVNRFDK